MKLIRRFSKTVQCVTLLTILGHVAGAQCTFPSGVAVFGTAAASTTSCAASVAYGCTYFSEYTKFTGLVVGNSYTITVTNTATAAASGPFTLGVYNAITTGTAPVASTTGAAFPISVTFTATAATVYTKDFTSGCGTSLSDCNYFTISNNSAPAPAPATNQPSTSGVAAGSTNAQVLRLDVGTCSAASVISTLNFSTTGSTSAGTDITAARVYYTTTTTFATTTQFGTAVATPNGSFTVTGSQSIPANSTGYFWLVYDIACGATVADVVDASITSFVQDGSTVTPTTPNPTGTRAITNANATARSDYNSTTAVPAGATAQAFAYANVTGSATCPGTLTSVTFNVTALAGQVSMATAYYSTSATFSTGTATAFGIAVSNPVTGAYTFTGSQALATGSNYFYLVYDIPCTPGATTAINADPQSVVVNGNTVTVTGTATSANAITLPYATAKTDPNGSTAVTTGSANNQMSRIAITGSANCPGTLTAINATLSGTYATGDVASVKVYYTTTTTFSTANQFGTVLVNPAAGTVTFTGFQLLSSASTNYFWLVFDISCTATLANTVNGDISSSIINGATVTPAAATMTANAIAAPAIALSDPNGTTAITAGSQDNQAALIAIPATGICSNTVTSLTATVSGTAASSDIVRAEVYYTTSSTFNISNATLFGTAIANPAAGTITFTGSQALSTTATNYFWLVYDINCASSGVTVNGNITSVTINGTATAVTGTAPAANSITANSTGTYYTQANGSWNNPATWACGSVPPTATTPVVVAHTITVNSSGNVAGNVTINSGASLLVTSGDLTMGTSSAGAATGNSNRVLTNNGTLDISGGTLNMNGSAVIASQFNMSGGTWNVDGNDGTSAGSAAGTILSITTTSVNVTGGAINVLDPPYSSSTTARAISYGASTTDISFGTGCTITLGGGDDVNPAATQGFLLESEAVSGTLEYGNIVVAGGRYSAQRHMSTYSSTLYLTDVKNLTVNAGAEVVIGLTPLAVTGNLVNNGIITTTSTTQGGNLAMVGSATYAATSAIQYTAATAAQSISGTGFFKYLTASADPTAQTGNLIGGITVCQAATSPGLTLNMPLTANGFVQLFGGMVNTTAANFLALGNGTTLPGNPATLTAGAGTLYGNAATGLIGQAGGTTYAAPGNYQGGWVVGPFNRYMLTVANTGQTGIFPVGGTMPHPARILFTTAPTAAGYLSGLWIDGSGDNVVSPALTEPAVTPSTINRVLNAMWQITSDAALTGGTYNAIFNNRAASLTDYANSTLLKRADAASAWTNPGTHVATTGSNTSPVVSRTGLTGFSQFSIGFNSTPLPVTLSSIAAHAAGTTNIVDWKTVTEANAASFEIERSATGREFTRIGTVTPSHAMDYSFTDLSPVQGINYYRLRTVDFNGEFSYSRIVTATQGKTIATVMNAYPNPTADKLVVEVAGASGNAAVSVKDVNGKLLATQGMVNGSTVINMTALPAGLYFVIYTDGADTKTLKVSKQ